MTKSQKGPMKGRKQVSVPLTAFPYLQDRKEKLGYAYSQTILMAINLLKQREAKREKQT